MNKMSIIIPAYNAAKTIVDVVKSVAVSLERVHGKTEIIVVDDGSKDGTGELLDGLSSDFNEEDVHLKVVHQANGGCYSARLAGLRMIDSEYFGFVDADDYVEPEMYEAMLNVAENGKFDVVECGWRFEGETKKDWRPVDIVERLDSKPEILGRYVIPTLVGCGESAYVWNKIYRNQYDFGTWIEGDFGSYEDLIHNLQLFRNVKSYARLSNRYYRYAPMDASVTKNFNAMHIVRLQNAAVAKRELIKAFVADSEVEPYMRKWLSNEKWNYIKKAILASRGSPLAVIQNLILASSLRRIK